MGELFDVKSNTVNYHNREIYKSEELEEISTTLKFRVVQIGVSIEVVRNT